MSSRLKVAVVGSRGRLGAFACELVARSDGFELAASFDRDGDWLTRIGSSGAAVAFEATRAGSGFEHGLALIERGLRPVIATSGVSEAQVVELDRAARARGLGGLVVPNFSLGALLLQRFCAEAGRWFEGAEIVELHHERKADAPSGTAAETARKIALARREAGLPPLAPPAPDDGARGDVREGVPIHSVRLPGLYAHQEVLFGSPGETLALRHDMSGPAAFAPGILSALRHASTAKGVARGLEHALTPAR